MKTCVCWAFIASILWFAESARGQGLSRPSIIVSGSVVDPSGAPIGGAAVSLSNKIGAPAKISTTTSNGEFAFPETAPGEYKLTVSSPGFANTETTVSVGASALAPIRIDLHLSATSSQVMVTGTRTATELDRSPVSASLVTRQEMETRNVNEVDQVLSQLEGVNAFRAKGPGDNDFQIGVRGFAGRGSPARTLILLDGQPLNDSYIGGVNWAMLPVSEFERVEVARGPSSSLYGGNAMGGVINLITRPVDQRQLEIAGQYGSMDTTTYSVRFSDRFFQKLGISLGYQRYQTGGYQDQFVLKSATTGTGAIPVTGVQTLPTTTGGINYLIGQYGGEWFNQQAYRARVEYAFSPKTFASIQYFHESRGGGYDAYTTNLKNSNGAPVDNGLVSFSDPAGVTRVLSVTPANFIGGPTGASTNTYQMQVLHTFSSQWNLRVQGGMIQTPLQWYITPGSNATPVSGGGSYTPQSLRAYYGSIQAGWNPSGRHQFVFGSEARHDAAGIVVETIPSWTSRDNGAPVTSQAAGQSVNQSVYGQDQIQLLERLTVVAGGRVDFWRTYNGSNQTSATVPATLYPDRGTTAVTGKVAANYQAPHGFILRASIGNAFRNPTLYELYRNLVLVGNLYAANPNAQPEHLLAWDAGVQRRVGARANLEATYFENRVHDMLYRTTDLASDPTGHVLRLTNAALGRIRGVELAFSERLLSWIQLKQAYTYTDGVITDNPSLPATVGKTLPYVPRHMISFTALVNRGRWLGSASGRYQSEIFSTDTNTDIVKGVPGSYSPFFTADLSAGYNLTKRITLTANVYNLLDRQFYMYYISPPRQVFGGIRIRVGGAR